MTPRKFIAAFSVAVVLLFASVGTVSAESARLQWALVDLRQDQPVISLHQTQAECRQAAGRYEEEDLRAHPRLSASRQRLEAELRKLPNDESGRLRRRLLELESSLTRLRYVGFAQCFPEGWMVPEEQM